MASASPCLGRLLQGSGLLSWETASIIHGRSLTRSLSLALTSPSILRLARPLMRPRSQWRARAAMGQPMRGLSSQDPGLAPWAMLPGSASGAPLGLNPRIQSSHDPSRGDQLPVATAVSTLSADFTGLSEGSELILFRKLKKEKCKEYHMSFALCLRPPMSRHGVESLTGKY